MIILGDMKELGNQSGEMHDQVARDVAASNIDVMMTIGDHAEHMAETAKQAKKKRTQARCDRDKLTMRQWREKKDKMKAKNRWENV